MAKCETVSVFLVRQIELAYDLASTEEAALGPTVDAPCVVDRLSFEVEVLRQGQPREPLRLVTLGRNVEPE